MVPRALKATIRLVDKIIHAGLGVILIAPSGMGKTSLIKALQAYYEESKEIDKIIEIVSANYTTLAFKASGKHRRLLVISDDLAVQGSYSHNILMDFLAKMISDHKFSGYLVQGRIPLESEVEEFASGLLGIQPSRFFDMIKDVDNFLALARDRFVPILILIPSLPEPLPPITRNKEFRVGLVKEALEEEDPLKGIPGKEEKLYHYLKFRYTENRAKDYLKRLGNIDGLELLILVNSLALIGASVQRDAVEGKITIQREFKSFLVGTQFAVQGARKLGNMFSETDLRCLLAASGMSSRSIGEMLKVLDQQFPTSTLYEMHAKALFQKVSVQEGNTRLTALTRGKLLKPLVEDVLHLKPPGYSPCEEFLLF